jgi:hypothetical protein
MQNAQASLEARAFAVESSEDDTPELVRPARSRQESERFIVAHESARARPRRYDYVAPSITMWRRTP